MRSIFVVTTLAVSLCFTSSASAQPSKAPTTQPPSDARTDQARELHIKGAALYEKGQYDKAEAAFLAAWALKKHYQLASNLGACEMKLGRFRDAAEHLAFFLHEQPPTGNQEDRKRTQALFDEARTKVGAVVVTVNVPGAVVSIDGREIGPAPLATEEYVDPGTRTLVATHGSYKDAQQIVEARAGGTQSVTLTLTSIENAAPPPLPPPPPRPLWPAITAGGLAVVALGVGTGLTVAANNKGANAAALQTMLDGNACAGAPTGSTASTCTALHNNGATQTTLANAAVGAFIAGGAVALVSAGLAVWTFTGRKDQDKRTAWRLHIAPSAGPREAGVAVVSQW